MVWLFIISGSQKRTEINVLDVCLQVDVRNVIVLKVGKTLKKTEEAKSYYDGINLT